MTLIGKYVERFADASHALPVGMHMNADYPFMLPRIVGLDASKVTIEGRDGRRETFDIKQGKHGECGYISQSSTFERMFNRKPTRFEMQPFKDSRTPAIQPAADDR